MNFQEVDDLELLHNVQIWIDENQNQSGHGSGIIFKDSSNINNNNGNSVISKNISLNKNQSNNKHSTNFFEANVNSDIGNLNMNHFNARKGSTKIGNSIFTDLNDNQQRLSPQNSDRYHKLELKHEQEKLERSVIYQKQQYFQKQIQSASESHNDSMQKLKQTQINDRSNIFNEDHSSMLQSTKPSIIRKINPNTNQKGSIFNKIRPLKPLQNKNYYLLKRFDAAMIFSQLNENNIYNIDYKINDLQLVGNQFKSKPSPLPQNYPNISHLDKKFMNKYSQNSKQTINDHKELLHFLKQKYQEQQDFILSQDSSVIQYQYSNTKQKHFDINNFEKYNNNNNSSSNFKYDQQKKLKKIQNLDHSISNEKCSDALILSDSAIQAPKSEVNKHRKFLSSVNQKNNQLSASPLKKQTHQRLTSQFQEQSLIDQISKTQDKNLKKSKEQLDQIQEINKIRKSAGINQRLRPKKNQNNNSTHILLQQQKLQENEKQEKMHKLQKQIKAKYNDISISQRQNFKEEPYKYIVIRGNNSELVKRCLDERNGDWQEITSANTLFNFKWIPFSKGIRFDYLTTHGQKKMVNHFEGQDQISQKDTLFNNLQRYCETQKQNVFQILPITFVVNLNTLQTLNELERFYLYFSTLEKNKKDVNIHQINSQILNHPLFTPVKYSQSTKYQITPEMFNGQNFWLIKPPDFNRGRGVQVFNSLDQFKKLMNDYQQGIEINLGQDKAANSGSATTAAATRQVNQDMNSTNESKNPYSIPQEQILKNFTNLENVPNVVKTNQLVIQKYLEKPLLIKKRKFDIRLWVLVGHDNKCYLFKEGYIRTSSQEFELTPQSIEKPFIHLTNNAVQRYNENYGAFEEGNQLSFKQAEELLEQDGEKCNFYEIIKNHIEDIIIKSLKSVENKLNQSNRKYCMEIFGYDFILDQNQKAWLIEVNTNPCLEESSTLLKFLIPRMIDDCLKLTVDQIFPPKKQKLQKQQKSLKFPQEATTNISEIIDETYQSIQLASGPGIGSEAGPIIIHKKDSATIAALTHKNEQQQSNHSSKDQWKSQNDYSKSLDSNQQQTSKQHQSKYHVEGYSDFENMWELIYQLKL